MTRSDESRASPGTIGGMSRLGQGARRSRRDDDRDEQVGLLREYLGFRTRPALLFAALLIGVMALVTAIYVSVFGMDTWSTNMQRAGSMMVIRFCPNCQGTAPAAPTGGGGTGTKRQL